MITLDRRTFLSGLAGSFAATQAASAAQQNLMPSTVPPETCWLDVAAPFVVVDPAQELTTEILLTATCFPGIEGYRETRYATEYQILLFDHSGKEIHLDNSGTVRNSGHASHAARDAECRAAIRSSAGAKVRVAPSPDQVPRAGDLFSAGFVRWNLPDNFDNVHAHPAPPQQAIGRFNYSMPFLPLTEYHGRFALFNPNEEESDGGVRVVDRMGRTRPAALSAAVRTRLSLYTPGRSEAARYSGGGIHDRAAQRRRTERWRR